MTARCRVDGADLTHTAPDRRPIGLMFQDHALFPHRTVEQNVAFGLRMAGKKESARTRRVREMLSTRRTGGFWRARDRNTFGGRSPACGARPGVAPAPKVLLLDEPLGSLDRHPARAPGRRTCPEVLGAQPARRRVHVTHDHDEAFAIGDRVAVIARPGRYFRSGRQVRCGPPQRRSLLRVCSATPTRSSTVSRKSCGAQMQ